MRIYYLKNVWIAFFSFSEYLIVVWYYCHPSYEDARSQMPTWWDYSRGYDFCIASNHRYYWLSTFLLKDSLSNAMKSRFFQSTLSMIWITLLSNVSILYMIVTYYLFSDHLDYHMLSFSLHTVHTHVAQIITLIQIKIYTYM